MGKDAGPLLLGHRGCRLKQFPENSMVAFRHAMESGCHGFEFDVRLTAERLPVCVHDDCADQLPVASSAYSELCNQHMKTGGNGGQGPIPLLQHVLEEFGGAAFLDIELKVAGMEELVIALLDRYRPARYVVSSFLQEALADLAERRPDLPLGFIFDDVGGLRAYDKVAVDYVMPRRDLITPTVVEAFHRDGKKVLAWTVNRPAEMVRFAEWGVDGLISDNPTLLRKTLARR